MGIEALGMQLAGAAAGQLLARSNDKRQLRQQEKMQGLQIQGQKEMTNYNSEKQMEMWHNTSYGAQKQEMEKAGINPALMYGMGGGGGQSSNVSAGNVSGGNAPSGGQEVQQMGALGMQMAAQIELLKAQKDNINADTENKLSEAKYTGGAKTENTIVSTANTAVKTELAEIEKRTEEARAQVAEGTVAEAIGEITYQMRKTTEEVRMMVRQNKINEATQDEVIKSYKLANAETLANVALKEVQKTNTVQMTEESRSKVIQWVKENVMRQQQLGNDGRKIDIQGLEQSVDQKFKEAMISNGQWSNFINGIGQMMRMGK